ncbi:hypothetical protein [Polaribacter sp. HL-MS24]|uniref:hypothetical protein n=1 Tax=Polaribacter sp. HL-MS24 TaxID=3077735 RepID=UPI002934F188|nr:hypothetical protein [Polaribacter sp. HL-MS24]WOC40016.1 hypothetical protein RRF69_10405 [Polaribacter sp. HL-MS24]
MTRAERLALIAFKSVMEDRKAEAEAEAKAEAKAKAEAEAEAEAEQTYLTEAHKKNSEAAMAYWESIDPSKVDWEKEVERQKKNATHN